jgi:formate hydrogenlyase subunit 4
MAALRVLQFVLLLASAPLTRGIIARMKAILQRRRGTPVWRPYYDLWKLFHKEDMVPPSASWLFRISPRAAFALTVTGATIVPVLCGSALLSFSGDFILLIYLLAFARFLLMLGALDPGSSFGGMGASREAMVSALAEAPLLLSLIAVAILAKSSNIASVVVWTGNQNFFDISAVHVLALTALIFVVLAEAGRMPVDNPTTHLELTMIHEAMVLEYSGPSLAFIEWGHALKLNLLIALVIALFAPWGIASGTGMVALVTAAAVYLLKLCLSLLGIAFLESIVAKLRMYVVPEFLGIASALAILAIVFTVILKR